MPLPFGKSLSAFTDLLKQPFELLHLFERDILEGTFDQCCMSTKERDEHLPSFLSQRHGPHPTILAALYAAHKALLIETIHSDADGAWIEVDLWADRIHWHRSLMQQHFEDAKIRLPQPLLEEGRKEITGHRLPGLQHDEPGMKRFWRLFALFHKNVNLVIILDIIYIDVDRYDIDG